MATGHDQSFLAVNPKRNDSMDSKIRLSDIMEESLGCGKHDTNLTDTSLVHVPGMRDSGNRRPPRKSKVKGRKTAEVKPSIPTGGRQPRVETIPTQHQNGKQILESADIQEDKTSLKKASLKDLCPEDKKRVANLVKELARVGEERETVLKAMDNERKQFEGQLEDLLSQQESILREREDIQGQLMSCQDMLAKYQKLSPDSQDLASSDDAYEPRRKAELYTPERKDHGSSRQINEQHSQAPVPRDGHRKDRDHSADRLNHRNSDSERSKEGSYGDRQSNGFVQAHPRHNDQNTVNTHHPRQDVQYGRRDHSTQYDRINSGRNQALQGQQSAGEPTQTTYHNAHENGYYHRNSSTTKNEVVSNVSEPPSSGSERPFTHMIDQLIEGGRHQDTNIAGVSGAFTEPRQSRYTETGPDPRGVPHYSPLNPPVQSSTLRSEISTETGLATRGHPEFQPLRPDHSPPSSLDPQSGGGATKIPNNLSDEEFMRFYQGMNPDDRRKELVAQKQALLKEQQQLKTILSQQEHLLSSKKQQLHKQQEVQKQRLEFFEKTGHFPPHNFNEQLLERNVAAPMEANHSKVQGNVQLDALEPQANPYVAPPPGHNNMPSSTWMPPPMYYSPSGPHQIGPPVPGPSVPPYAVPAGYVPHPGAYHPGPPYPPQPYPAQSAFPEQGMVLEALGNMDLGHRPPPSHRHQQESRPSPHERGLNPAHHHDNSTHQARRHSSKSSPARQEGRIPGLASLPSSPHRPPPAAGLVDIVDEVERFHSHSRGGSTPHRRGYSGNSSFPEEERINRHYVDPMNETYSEDEAEESQVLEDIFFVK